MLKKWKLVSNIDKLRISLYLTGTFANRKTLHCTELAVHNTSKVLFAFIFKDNSNFSKFETSLSFNNCKSSFIPNVDVDVDENNVLFRSTTSTSTFGINELLQLLKDSEVSNLEK